MSVRFLVFLLITGGLSLVVMAVPVLILFGFIALIVPGLILMSMPTLFIWGVLYAILWLPFRWALEEFAAIAGAAATAFIILVTIPLTFNFAAQRTMDAERAQDHMPSSPIALRGVVQFSGPLFHTATAGPPRLDCDVMCLALLYTPGIDAVILGTNDGTGKAYAPVEFRIEKQETGCAADQSGGAGSDTWRVDRDLLKSWLARQAAGECIARYPASSRADFHLSLETHQADRRRGRWDLYGPGYSLRRLTIDRVVNGRSQPLLRRSFAWTRKLWFPLTVLPDNPLTGDFGWGRRSEVSYKGPGHFDPVTLLRETTNIALTTDPKRTGDAVRQQIGAAIADAQRPAGDAGFALAPAFFEDVGKNGPQPADRALIAALVRDSRVTEFNRIWEASRRFEDGLPELRPLIVNRLLAASAPGGDAGASTLGLWLASLPAGAYAISTAAEERLIADPERREWATGLVRRLSDRGPSAAPLLAQLITEPKLKSAARSALCVLGPQAAAVLPQVEASEGSWLSRDHAGQLMLLRLGKPIDSFVNPPNGPSDEQFREELHNRLERFQATDCD